MITTTKCRLENLSYVQSRTFRSVAPGGADVLSAPTKISTRIQATKTCSIFHQTIPPLHRKARAIAQSVLFNKNPQDRRLRWAATRSRRREESAVEERREEPNREEEHSKGEKHRRKENRRKEQRRAKRNRENEQSRRKLFFFVEKRDETKAQKKERTALMITMCVSRRFVCKRKCCFRKCV